RNVPGHVPLSTAETAMLERVRSGERLTLSDPNRHISGNFLRAVLSQLKDSQALKMNGLQIDGAEFSDDASIGESSVPFTVHLTNCYFFTHFSVRGPRFEVSLVIEESVFKKGFQFQSTVIKEDLIVRAKPSSSQPPAAFGIGDTHVDGRTEITTVASGTVDN